MPQRRPAQIHNLRPNHAEWSPEHVLFFDTEATTSKVAGDEILAFKCWAARIVDREISRDGDLGRDSSSGCEINGLVDYIQEATVGRKTVWVYAHNLSFDLVITRLPLVLVEHGWRITDAAVGGRAPWMRFSKGSKRLTFLDSGGLLPKPLSEIAAAMGTVKRPLPNRKSSEADWLERCITDVDVLAAAVCEVMNWWDRNKRGRWTVSGAASGWNAMRHTPTRQRVVIDPDPAGVRHDREAIHGGRRGVWRMGEVGDGPLLELDLVAAYPTVALHMPLPVKRSTPFDSLPVDDWRINNPRWGLVAECVINTDTAQWPVRTSRGTWYPVGRFTTTLAGPDVASAARQGVLESIGPGYVHKLGYAMRDWAQWCIDTQNGDHPDSPPIVRMACKGWGRSVIGKWASHAYERVELGASPVQGWGYTEGWDHGSQSRGGMVDIAGRRWWVSAASEPDNAYPAVLAFVEAHVRVLLSRVLDTLGPLCTIQCDTDGLIVRQDELVKWARRTAPLLPGAMPDAELVQRAVSRLNELCAPLALRVKRSHARATVVGPQHLELPGDRRFSGLPKSAIRMADGKYAGHAWPKLQWQMAHGHTEGYVRPPIEATMSGPYATGWVLNSGRVVPVQMMINSDGSNVILPWSMTVASDHGARLAPLQNPSLAGI